MSRESGLNLWYTRINPPLALTWLVDPMPPWVRLPGCDLESGHDRIRSASGYGLNVEVLEGLIHADERAVVAVSKEVFPEVDKYRRC